MSTTWSTNLGIALIGTGDQAGTWGSTTNTNLGTLIEQAISGYVTQAITDGADTTVTMPDGATGVARNMFLELTGALTAARNLIVPAKKKLYFIYNNTSGGFSVTVKVTGLTGIAVPNGKKMVLVCDGTDIFVATSHFIGTLVGDVTGNVTGNASGTAVNITGVAALANGGTGATSAGAARLNILPSIVGNGLKVMRVNSGATDIEWFTLASSSADVVGPASATDNALARFDTTTGKLIQSSSATLDDSGILNVPYFVGNGANLTALNASNVSTGTLASARLPMGVAFTNAAANFTAGLQKAGLDVGLTRVMRSEYPSGGTASTTAVGTCLEAGAGVTLPASTFSSGDVLSIYNYTASPITITQGGGLTLRMLSSTGNRTLAAYGLATVWFSTSAEAVIVGSGLS